MLTVALRANTSVSWWRCSCVRTSWQTLLSPGGGVCGTGTRHFCLLVPVSGCGLSWLLYRGEGNQSNPCSASLASLQALLSPGGGACTVSSYPLSDPTTEGKGRDPTLVLATRGLGRSVDLFYLVLREAPLVVLPLKRQHRRCCRRFRRSRTCRRA